MSVTSGFFNSLNGDRRYSADQMSALFDNLITDGVFSNVGTAFAVTASGTDNAVTIGIGRAWFNSTWLYNSTLLPMYLDDAEVVLDRIDAIVIEVDRNDAVRNATIRVVRGAPSSEPKRPTMASDDRLHQHPLAYIYRSAGSTKIIQANITSVIGTSECPYVTGILKTQSIDSIVAQWENEFDAWFEGLQGSLEGDVGVELANRILQLENKFDTLTKDRAIYDDLEDSNGEVITDSSKIAIWGTTTLGDIIVPDENPGVAVPEPETEQYKVGDILTTARTDLDETWLLCNGGTLQKGKYEELESILPVVPSGPWDDVHNIGTPSENQYWSFTGAACDEDVSAAYVMYSTENDKAYVYYGSQMIATSKKEVWGAVNGVSSCNMVYGGGYFLTGGSERGVNGGGVNRYAIVAAASDPSGSWTVQKFAGVSSSASGSPMIEAVGYGEIEKSEDSYDRYFLGLGRTNTGDTLVAWSTNNPTGSWTSKTFTKPSNAQSLTWHAITCGGGYYLRGGHMRDTSEYYNAYIEYATDLNGPWTGKDFWYFRNSGTSNSNSVYDMLYHDGRFIIVGTYYNGTKYRAVLDWNSDPSKLGSTTVLWESDDYVSVTSIRYISGYYVVTGSKRFQNPYFHGGSSGDPNTLYCSMVAYASDIAGPWTVEEVWGPTTRASDILVVMESENAISICGTKVSGAGNKAYVSSYMYKNSRLPSISMSNNTHTYIKAKIEV